MNLFDKFRELVFGQRRPPLTGQAATDAAVKDRHYAQMEDSLARSLETAKRKHTSASDLVQHAGRVQSALARDTQSAIGALVRRLEDDRDERPS